MRTATKGTPTHAGCGATSSAYQCAQDGEPCEVVELFNDALLAEVAREDGPQEMPAAEHWSAERIKDVVDAVSDQLPCEWCHAAEKAITGLSSIHLGKHERRILLVAPSNGGKYEAIEPDGESRSAAEANRRAMRKLKSAGLLHLTWQGVGVTTRQYAHGAPVRRTYRKSAVRLTPLGAAVVDRLRESLQEGRRIRWADHAELVTMVRKQPEELLTMFRARLAQAAKHVSEFAGMVQLLNPEAPPRQQDRARAFALVLEAVSRIADVERPSVDSHISLSLWGGLDCLTDHLTELKGHG